MKARTASRLAWWLWAVIPATVLGSVLLVAVTAYSIRGELPGASIVLILLFAFGTVGALVASRRPENTIGWILLGTGVAWAVVGLGDTYAAYAAAAGLTGTLLARLADWPNLWFFAPGLFLPVTVLLLLFPTGSPPSRRWRPLVWAAVIGNAALALCLAFDPESTSSDSRFLRSNPFGIPGAHEPILVINQIAWWISMAAFFASGVAIVMRLRRSHGDERAQLRWLTTSGLVVVTALFVVIFFGSVFGWESDPSAEVVIQVVVLAAITTIPIAAGIAVLRYRLYDIDVVVRKTVVYGILAVLVFVIGGSLIRAATGLVFASRGDNGLLLAGIVIGLLVWPLRRLALWIADRLVFGGRATPYQVLTEFSGRAAETYGAEDALVRMAQVLAVGVGAESATVWLRSRDGFDPGATWPAVDPPSGPMPAGAIEVRHQGELLGALSVRMPANDPMTPSKERLIRDLAGQAGLVLRNAKLIADLRASRQRLVAAQDDERRRLERNIHDGAQQQLVALSVKLRLASGLIGRDPDQAVALLHELQTQATETLEDLRDLARGIYPPLLADQGLRAALEGQARKASLPVTVETDGIGRYPPEIESAVYFSCLEALQNVAKYAEASSATVRLAQSNGSLTFEVVDDGIGFDPVVAVHGSGLQGIADRLAAVGGELEVRSAPGDGTAVAGRLPVAAAP